MRKVYDWAARPHQVHLLGSHGCKTFFPLVQADARLTSLPFVRTRYFLCPILQGFIFKSDWYDVNATAFQAYLELFYTTFQRPLWITEWACQNYNDANAQCSASDVVRFLNQTQGFMDQSPYVERYAWYGAMENLYGINPVGRLDLSSGGLISNYWFKGRCING